MGSPSIAGGKRGGMAEHQWGVGSGRGLLMCWPRLEPKGEKGMCMRSRCFFKPFFLLG